MKVLKNIVLLLVLQVFLLSACKEEKKDTPTPNSLPKNTSILFVNGLSDASGITQIKSGSEIIADVPSKGVSAYIKVSEGNQKLTLATGASFNVVIEKDKYYTVLLSGSSASPKVEVLVDNLSNVSDPATKFSYRFVNLFSAGNDSLSMQAYYPNYKSWATQANINENVAYGKASASTEYTAGAAAQWRAIKSGSEDVKEYIVSGLIYRIGSQKVYYEAASTFAGAANKHYSIIVFGSENNGSSVVLEHESKIIQ